MKIVIEATPKEIAALAKELQGRRETEPVVAPGASDERYPRALCVNGSSSSTDN